MNKYKGLTKHGNFWSVKKYIFGKQKWFNTGIRFSEETRPQAEKWYLKHFGREKQLSTFQKQIAYDQKHREKQKEERELTRLSFFLDKFIETRVNDPKIKKSTLMDYQSSISRFIDFTDNCYMEEINLNIIRKFRDELAQSMTGNGVDRYLTRLKVFLNFIIDDDQKKFERLASLVRRMKSLKVGMKKQKKVMSEEDFNLLTTFADDGTTWGTFLSTYHKFAASTGARLIECLRGQIDDNVWRYVGKRGKLHEMTLNNDQIQQWYVLNNFLKKDEDGLTDQSSIKDLSVRVSKATTMLCRKVLLYNNPDFLKKNGLSKRDLVYLSNKKTNTLGIKLLYVNYAKVNGTTVSKLSSSQKREAKTQNVSFHSIRHKMITDNVLRYGSAKVMAHIGHANISTTEGYTHISQKDVSKEINRVN